MGVVPKVESASLFKKRPESSLLCLMERQKASKMPYPSLAKSYKKMFPFKLATTSYIFPDRVVPNVTSLAPFLDEIELILFESEGQEDSPDQEEIETLMNLSSQHQVGFNIHLPLDIFLGDKSETIRSKGISIVRRTIKRTLPLQPSVYTLHLDRRNKYGAAEPDIEIWQRRILQSIEEIARDEIGLNPISIETLEYSFEWIEDLVKKFGFSICLDIGHILIQGRDLGYYLDKYLVETSIIHLHGFQNSTDHLGIDRLSDSVLKQIFSRLHDYHGIVSLEVFSMEDLEKSLATLEEKWGRR
jgi:sugar phosphate isomerase/epimerase